MVSVENAQTGSSVINAGDSALIQGSNFGGVAADISVFIHRSESVMRDQEQLQQQVRLILNESTHIEPLAAWSTKGPLDCELTTPHSTILCSMPVGAGSSIQWTVVVGD